MGLTYDFPEGIASTVIRTWKSACSDNMAMLKKPENTAAGGARPGIEAGVDEICDLWYIGCKQYDIMALKK